MPEKPTKLYEAIISFNLYLLATDEADATGVAVRNAAKELDNLSPDRCVEVVAEVASLDHIDLAWRGSRPYATPGTAFERLTCEAALKEIQASARRADLPGQQRLFEGA